MGRSCPVVFVIQFTIAGGRYSRAPPLKPPLAQRRWSLESTCWKHIQGHRGTVALARALSEGTEVIGTMTWKQMPQHGYAVRVTTCKEVVIVDLEVSKDALGATKKVITEHLRQAYVMQRGSVAVASVLSESTEVFGTWMGSRCSSMDVRYVCAINGSRSAGMWRGSGK